MIRKGRWETMSVRKKGFIPRRKVANSKLELAISLFSAAVTLGSIVQKALEKSREYKAQQEKAEQGSTKKSE